MLMDTLSVIFWYACPNPLLADIREATWSLINASLLPLTKLMKFTILINRHFKEFLK